MLVHGGEGMGAVPARGGEVSRPRKGMIWVTRDTSVGYGFYANCGGMLSRSDVEKPRKIGVPSVQPRQSALERTEGSAQNAARALRRRAGDCGRDLPEGAQHYA